MRIRMITLSAGLAILFSSLVSMAQDTAKKKTATAERGAASRIEPLRVINGEMRGRTVSGQFNRGARLTNFTFTFTRAEVVNGRLQLKGDFALEGGGARLTDQVIATIAGAIAEAANPWPRAGDEPRKDAKKSREAEKKAGEQVQGREAKNPEAAAQLGQLAQSTQDTARTTPPAPGEKTEQTQSLYAQSEGVTGCSVMFLKLTMPQRVRARIGAVAGTLQLGMVLKGFDNERGEEIGKQICRLGKTFETGNQSARLAQLNRLLAPSK
jgi:hypothetical protein